MTRNQLPYDNSAFMLTNKDESNFIGDMVVQYPTSISQMQVPANSTVTTINTAIDRKLMAISVSVPTNCIMTVHDGSSEKFFFSDESGTLRFPNGIYFDQVKITLANATASPVRFTYRLIFA